MPSPQALQPVLKMKVDELFLNWLSEPNTQVILKDYLRKIKNGDELEFAQGECNGRDSLVFTENNNVASKNSITERTSASFSASCSPPSATLPSGSGCSNRVGPSSRALRRSISIKKVRPLMTCLSYYFSTECQDFPLCKASPSVWVFVYFVSPQACECPLYWKAPLFYAAGGDRRGYVSVHKFVAMWRKVLQNCHDDASKFIHLLAKPGCPYLEQEDFIPFLQDVVDSHAGLAFLKEASDFHSRYITTVIQRIFYNVNRSWTGKITCSELRRSSLLQNVALLDEEDDINQLTEYFSYEHFYVVYCKFWELDTDHDLYIDQRDLARHNDQAISHRMIERIFSGTVTRDRKVHKESRLSYSDFVWFLISEEDKKTETSIEYWFRCMDLDGDGVLSMYELQYFYQEQCHKLEAMAIEPLPFEDCLCQMLDLVRPELPGNKITLRDLKRCKLAHIFFDTFFNIEKYLDHEQKDPFMVAKDAETLGQEISDWERYAAEEYDVLVAEEAANEQYNDG
uniref:EF-hand domain-containing protein n=1 Tax=Electrophorus electricus TaxID=8005 RepID=A0A4W4HFM5_ELEEL